MSVRLRRRLAAAEGALDRWKRRLQLRFGWMDPLVVQPFRTYASPDALWLRGRVLEEKGIRGADPDASVWKNVRDAFHRYESDELPGARVEIDLGGRTEILTTDEEGYFDATLKNFPASRLESPWTSFPIRLLEPLVDDQEPHRTEAHVAVPGPDARFGVVSDLDDTVIRTGATDLLKRLRIEVLHNAATREPFPGVPAFYQSLSDGGRNPFFYVSSSPWNLFGLFEDFLAAHDIPPGPLLFKEMGLTEHRWLEGGHDEYKARRIERILDSFPDLPFVLIGDSGQRDPVIYEKVVADHPGRILAIYIRHVAESEPGEIREAADRLRERGVDMLLVEDCAAAARHARTRGWIGRREAERVVAAVRGG